MYRQNSISVNSPTSKEIRKNRCNDSSNRIINMIHLTSESTPVRAYHFHCIWWVRQIFDLKLTGCKCEVTTCQPEVNQNRVQNGRKIGLTWDAILTKVQNTSTTIRLFENAWTARHTTVTNVIDIIVNFRPKYSVIGPPIKAPTAKPTLPTPNIESRIHVLSQTKSYSDTIVSFKIGDEYDHWSHDDHVSMLQSHSLLFSFQNWILRNRLCYKCDECLKWCLL